MIDRPIVVIGAPRSGTTLLFRCLAAHPDVWHLPAESHSILEGPLHPDRLGRASNRCTAEDYDEERGGTIRRAFYRQAINLNRLLERPGFLLGASSLPGRAASRAGILALGALSRVGKKPPIRFLEKTPKNSLRVPFLTRLFPDAKFIWLRRNPLDNIDSLVAGWHASDQIGPFIRRRFGQAGYRVAAELELQDYDDEIWKFALVPGWQDLRGGSIGDVATWQYYQCNLTALRDFAGMDASRVQPVAFESFLEAPLDWIRRLLAFSDLGTSESVIHFAEDLPVVNTVGSTDASREGLRYRDEVLSAVKRLPELNGVALRLGYDDWKARMGGSWRR